MRTEWSPAFDNAQQALSWLADEKPDYAIVCATSTLTETVMEQLLAGRPEELVLDAAGKYDASTVRNMAKCRFKWLHFRGSR